ncbi:efflux RND transporter periplasmic adaptor subunit [Marinilabilia salmonicolor]|jgi:RND family efflux transporter MFP subunit|uniref:efflux RND transporter periplasmic adaptor subunit n=1 Tax=Marinilabilia salmonicolor TaxID=989 RepID=UPI002159B5EE|nr:efflux RND transporter periplasmic adaptor subunit [Marinilabilia salmonicolor]
MMNRFLILVIATGLSWAMVSCGAATENAEAKNDAERVENVKITELNRSTVTRKIDISTTLEGYETVNIAPSLTGIIEEIYVEVGSRVKKGDRLVRLDQSQYKTAKLTYSNAKIEFERLEVLKESGTVSQQAYDQAKLALDQARENLEFLEPNTYVKAPIRGVISEKNYEEGELFNGSPILTLTQTHQLKALISISESYVPFVKEGMELTVKPDVYKNQEFPAVIEIVYPTIDPATHTFQAKVRIPNSDNLLRPGMYVQTSIDLQEVEALMVPYRSVMKLTGSDERYVFVNENGRAKRVRVEMGQRFNDLIEVSSDELEPGDQLVTVGQAKLIEGVKLNVVK